MARRLSVAAAVGSGACASVKGRDMKERTRQFLLCVWRHQLPRLWNPMDNSRFARQMEARIWTAWAGHILPRYRVGDSLNDETFDQCEKIARRFMREMGYSR